MKSNNFKKLLRLSGTAIAKYKMIQPNDHILIGLSGGKDSMMLLHVLHELKRKAPFEFKLTAVTFDPQFPGFNAQLIHEYCEQKNFEHHLINLDVTGILTEHDAAKRPCVLCSRLRRGKLYGMAEKLQCNKVALGHNLDDIAISLLIGLFRGQGLTTMGPNVKADNLPLRIIRPLAMAPESLVKSAREEFEIPDAGKCQYGDYLQATGDRAFFGALLDKLEQRIPHVREQMLHSMSDVRPNYLLDLKFIDLGDMM